MIMRIDKTIRENPMFTGLFLFAIVLYCQQSWVPGFFHDGYLYAAFGKNAAEQGYWLIPHASVSTYSRFFHHTPTVFILEGLFFKIFGASYTTARIFSASFSIATLSLIIYWLRSVGEKRWAYYAGVLFLCLPALLKKTRFPSLDPALMLFVLTSIYFYWKSLEKKDLKNWLLCGLFFGICLLTKGPMAVLVLMIMGLHLLLSKNLKDLASFKPWLGLVLGLAVFSIWPISLKLTDNIDIFYKYIDFIFLDTIKDARGEASPFYTYLVFLLKNSGPWFLLAIFTIYKYIKKDYNNSLILIFITSFLAILIPLSFASFKYSHYLIPLYPALAILAAFPLVKRSEAFHKKFQKIFLVLSIITTLILLIFPVTNKSKRDPEIFKIRALTEMLKESSKNWVIVDGIYPFWSLHNLNAWTDHSNTFNVENKNLTSWTKSNNEKTSIILVHKNIYKNKSAELNKTHRPLILFSKRQMAVLVDKRLLNEEFDFSVN